MSPLTPPSDAAALLFDCDGTLVDSLPAWHHALRRTLAEFGTLVEWEFFDSCNGLSLEQLTRRAIPDADEATIAGVAELGGTLFIEGIDRVRAYPDVADIVRRNHGVRPMAVVSGSPLAPVRAMVEAAGMLDLVDAVIGEEDWPAPKPDPGLYRIATERLGIAADRCFAYEDSEPGLGAARAAGIRVLDVRPLR